MKLFRTGTEDQTGMKIHKASESSLASKLLIKSSFETYDFELHIWRIKLELQLKTALVQATCFYMLACYSLYCHIEHSYVFIDDLCVYIEHISWITIAL